MSIVQNHESSGLEKDQMNIQVCVVFMVDGSVAIGY